MDSTVTNEDARTSDLQANEDDQNRSSPKTENRAPLEHRLWRRERDLTIHSIGYSVGIGNLWRFPFIAYNNGGGAFLVPYLIIVCIIGFPLYLMELFLGQFSHLDPINVWKFCPFFTGVGYSITINTAVILTYYSVLQMYGLFYLIQSLRSILPWSVCFFWWGADSNCYQSGPNVIFCDDVANKSKACTNATQSSSEQFWKKYVLDLSSGDPQTIKWDLAVSLLGIWCISLVFVVATYYRIISSQRCHVKCFHQVGLFTAGFPLALLLILAVYALYQEGAVGTLLTLLAPNWTSLLNVSVWSEAAQQCVYSLGLGQGGLIVFGCKSRAFYNFKKCAIISIFTDTAASVIAAVNTFIIAGVLYSVIKLDYNDYTLSGIGLVFVTYPEAVNTMAIPVLWSILFFSMYITLAIDPAIGMLQTVALGVQQCFPSTKKHPVKTILILCALLYLAGLSCVTKGGIDVLHLFDAFSNKALLGITAFEAVAFGWGYGTKRMVDDIKNLTGSAPNIALKILWTAIVPLFTIVLFIFALAYVQLPPLNHSHHPRFAYVIGWGLVVFSIMPIPICMVLSVFHNEKSLKKAFEPYESWMEATSR